MEFPRYLARTYIGRLNKKRVWVRPRYEITLWNVRGLILNGLPSTNCAIEALHRAFKESLPQSHPPVSFRFRAPRKILQFAPFMSQLRREHAWIDWLLEQQEEPPADHRYFEVVNKFEQYLVKMHFFRRHDGRGLIFYLCIVLILLCSLCLLYFYLILLYKAC